MALCGWSGTALQRARPAVAPPSRPRPPTAARTAAAAVWVRARRAGRRAQPVASACSAAGSSGFDGGSNSSISSDGSATVAAFLAQQGGLDPGQLQREQPAAFAQLTLPLAKVLAEVHRAREGSGKELRVGPSELMARICFLHYSAGLQPAEMLQLWQRDARLLNFDREKAATLRDWLCSLEFRTQAGQGADGRGQLQRVGIEQLRRFTQYQADFWSKALGTLQQNKAAAEHIVGLSEADWAATFVIHPVVASITEETLQSIADWLTGLGLSRAALARLWSAQPHMFCTSAATLDSNLRELLRRCPLTPAQQRQFVQGNGSLLTRDSQKLLTRLDRLVEVLPGIGSFLPKFLLLGSGALSGKLDRLLHKVDALRAYGFTQDVLEYALKRYPNILTFSLEEKLLPLLAELERLLGSSEEVVRAVGLEASLLTMALGTIKSNEELMAGHGLSGADIRACISKCPLLFVWDMASEEMSAKLRYFDEMLGRPPYRMLTEHPSFLRYSLYRVDRKRAFMALKGDKRYEANLGWIKWTDTKLCSTLGCSQDEFEAWWPQWLQSETVAKYGIKEPRPAFSQAQEAWTTGRRGKVAARRQARLAAAVEAEE